MAAAFVIDRDDHLAVFIAPPGLPFIVGVVDPAVERVRLIAVAAHEIAVVTVQGHRQHDGLFGRHVVAPAHAFVHRVDDTAPAGDDRRVVQGMDMVESRRAAIAAVGYGIG